MLSQLQNGMEHPVMYISRKLLPHEKNYATIEKECLAIKWAIEKLRYYLLGRKFILVTDHAPLKWMSQNKGKNARITRWFLQLQDFQFKVEHRAVNSHANADAMSRRPAFCGMYAPSGSLELERGVCGGQKEVWSPTKQLEHLQHHGEPHQGKQQGLGHPVRGFRTRDSYTTGVHHFSSNREPQLQAVRDNQQLPHKREQRPQYSLSAGETSRC